MNIIRGQTTLEKTRLTVISTASRELAIRVCSLDSLPQDETFRSALVAMSKRYSESRIRILYTMLGNTIEQGHPIIGLRRRLPSVLVIHQCDEFDASGSEQWWLADRFNLLFQEDENKPLATHDDFAKSLGPKLLGNFEYAWQRSREDPQIREIFL